MQRRASSRQIALFFAAAVLLPACSQPQALIESGEYRLPDWIYKEPVYRGVTLTIDRDARTAVLTLSGRSRSLTWTPLPEEQWGTGCHTDSGHTELEIAALSASSLTVGQLTFDRPVLVAQCPARIGQVHLTAPDVYERTGCAESFNCLLFQAP